jgi:manganese transport protein
MLGRLFKNHTPNLGALEVMKYIGPGFIVTVGFIDPGNWAANIGAGASFGYTLLWIVTLSTILLVILQHHAAHLGIATGLCLSEAATAHLPRWIALPVLGSAVLAVVATSFAEILGAAIGLKMLTGLPLPLGALLTAIAAGLVLFTNGYRRIERIIIGMVSLVGLGFLFEFTLVDLDWPAAIRGWVTPSFPSGSLPLIVAILGAVVMPHNLFLHSEVIQSRKWNLEDETTIRRQLRYEFLDTLASMGVGWAINSAMILVAAAVFFTHGTPISELSQAEAMLRPLLGNAAAVVFAVALLLAGFSSSVTAAMAGGSIAAGMFGEPYDMKDNHSRLGVLVTLGGAALLVLAISAPFQGLIASQIALSIQLPFTILALVLLTSSRKVMGRHANTPGLRLLLATIGVVVAALNIALVVQAVR